MNQPADKAQPPSESRSDIAGLLKPDERKALEAFYEQTADAGVYHLPDEMMKRLAEIGVVRRTSGQRYATTEIGEAIVNGVMSEQQALRPPTDAPVAWQHSDGRLLTAGQLNSAASAIKDSWKNATPLYAASVSASEPNWISVKDRLPELNQIVAARKDSTSYPEIITYMAGARWGVELVEWTPLPTTHRTESATPDAMQRAEKDQLGYALGKLSMALGHPAFIAEPPNSIESLLIEHAALRIAHLAEGGPK